MVSDEVHCALCFQVTRCSKWYDKQNTYAFTHKHTGETPQRAMALSADQGRSRVLGHMPAAAARRRRKWLAQRRLLSWGGQTGRTRVLHLLLSLGQSILPVSSPVRGLLGKLRSSPHSGWRHTCRAAWPAHRLHPQVCVCGCVF